MTVYSLAAHRGHFYNCENGHTFVIGEVSKHRNDSLKIQGTDWTFTVWRRNGDGTVPRVQCPDWGL